MPESPDARIYRIDFAADTIKNEIKATVFLTNHKRVIMRKNHPVSRSNYLRFRLPLSARLGDVRRALELAGGTSDSIFDAVATVWPGVSWEWK